jgi:hypothetical protein
LFCFKSLLAYLKLIGVRWCIIDHFCSVFHHGRLITIIWIFCCWNILAISANIYHRLQFSIFFEIFCASMSPFAVWIPDHFRTISLHFVLLFTLLHDSYKLVVESYRIVHCQLFSFVFVAHRTAYLSIFLLLQLYNGCMG